jgi:streptogramin lyase
MRKYLPLLLIGLLFITACSKKSTPVANQVVTVVTAPLPAGTVTTLAGSGAQGSANGTQGLASFNAPAGVAVDLAGHVYVADFENFLIRGVTSNGMVTTLAGSGVDSLANGTGAAASFSFPVGVAVDASYNVYVADLGNEEIRKITPNGVVTTFAGSGAAGSANGSGTAVSFSLPTGVAVDASGNVYVADQNNNLIREINPSGTVSTLAGSGSAGYVNGAGTGASFNTPSGVAVDASGNVYVADLENRVIRKITPAGVVSTFAGAAGGSVNFSAPVGVAVDANGNVYVADQKTNLISMITPAGVATTLAGSGAAGSANGVGTTASFNFPTGVAVDFDGNVYVADRGNNMIRKISSGK